jgi:ribulose-5-phosphate 4-epimerase/fuculose-1-phosphate aldolase
VEPFATAGRTLFSLGLVKGAEGNLSTFDGNVLTITRTGCSLASLADGDVLEGSLDDPPAGASSDLAEHVDHYRRSGPGAVAHAHPAGSVPEDWVEGQPHGIYAFAPTLEEAVAVVVEGVRARAAGAVEDGTFERRVGGAVEG